MIVLLNNIFQTSPKAVKYLCILNLFPLALQPNSDLDGLHETFFSLKLLNLGQPVRLLGGVISSSQGLYLYTNTEKRTQNTNNKDLCPEWDSNSNVPSSLPAMTVHALDRSATVTGVYIPLYCKN
jgi:hypothetical protein